MNVAELETEIWLPAPGFEEIYSISSYGNVLSNDRYRLCKNDRRYIVRGKRMKPFLDKDGYLEILFCADGREKRWKMHRLVAFLYVDGWSDEMEVNHIDFNKQNNYYKNLNYKTKVDNVIYSRDNGRMKNNGKNLQPFWINQKKPILQFNFNNVFVREWPSTSEVPKTIADHSAIWNCMNGNYKHAGGFVWKYK